MPQVHQVPSDADDQLETGNGTARQHVPAGLRMHQRVPVRVVSAARVRTAVPVDDPAVHRVGRTEVRHDQSLLSAHEVRSILASFLSKANNANRKAATSSPSHVR